MHLSLVNKNANSGLQENYIHHQNLVMGRSKDTGSELGKFPVEIRVKVSKTTA